jgi:hypothetical protein
MGPLDNRLEVAPIRPKKARVKPDRALAERNMAKIQSRPGTEALR